MKKIILVTIFFILIAAIAAVFWWPLRAPSQPNLSPLVRTSLVVQLPPELSGKTSRPGFFSWLGIRGPSGLKRPEVGTALTNIISTGFASSPYQTDASPCRTAAGNIVRPGTVASNFLPLGTLLKLKVGGEELPGTFIVEDRMADRFNSRIDIWFAKSSQALDFGKRRVEITVVGYGQPGQSLADVKETQDLASAPVGTVWETVKLRARSIAEFLTTRGVDVNRFDVDCLQLQQAELGV